MQQNALIHTKKFCANFAIGGILMVGQFAGICLNDGIKKNKKREICIVNISYERKEVINLTYEVIGTGSSGNAVVINDFIMVDCGLPWKKIEPYSKKLKLVLLTHEHGDHFKPSTVKKLHEMRPSLRFGGCQWMVKHLLDAGVCKSVIDVYNCDIQYGYYYNLNDGIEIYPIHLPHNVPNCGYKILFKNGEKLFYATDCSSLDHITCEGFDWFLIEANHKESEIQERIQSKLDSGEFAYEFAAMRNHLSEEQAMDWLAKNVRANSKYVFLHQHKMQKIRSK